MCEQVKFYNMRQKFPDLSMAVEFMPDVVVSHRDYATLQAECERLRLDLLDAIESKIKWMDRYKEVNGELEVLKVQLRA